MNVLGHLKGNFIISGTAVGVGLLSKHLLKKEFIPVSSTMQMTKSYFFILGTTIIGKLIMDKVYENHLPPYTGDTKGKTKIKNEGFIGPLASDLNFIGPNTQNKNK